MTFTDLAIVVLGGLIGWGVVSWIISIVRQQKQPPLDLTGDSPGPRDLLRSLPRPASGDHAPTAVTGRGLSLAEVSTRWSTILRVPESASPQDIEAAYHAGLAECDRIRFSPSESAAAKADAEGRRTQITQAFEFIRPLRS